jgi:hypothetical protein
MYFRSSGLWSIDLVSNICAANLSGTTKSLPGVWTCPRIGLGESDLREIGVADWLKETGVAERNGGRFEAFINYWNELN